jgi:uncharacterized repeat protein (TIGR01451 family)
MAASADRVSPGENFIYTVTVLNEGLSFADNVTLTDSLPNGLRVVLVFSNVGACSDDGQTVDCNLGALAIGASAIVKIIVSTTAAGNFINSASASTSDLEPNSANNSASMTTAVGADIAPVTLAIQSRVDGSVEISWPADSPGFVLEATESLVPAVAWSPVTNSPQIVAGKKVVISDNISSSQFFRLRRF